MKFAPKHVVTMVVALSAAAVLAPVGVLAATGQLVNIADPFVGGNLARVSEQGALLVETRPRAQRFAVNVNHVDVASLSPRKLMETTAPNRIALNEISISVRDFGNPVVAATIVEIVSYVRDSGTNPCGSSGWTPRVLRRITLNTDETLHIPFDHSPLVTPPVPSGKTHCLAAKLYQWVGDTRVDIGATTYAFSS